MSMDQPTARFNEAEAMTLRISRSGRCGPWVNSGFNEAEAMTLRISPVHTGIVCSYLGFNEAEAMTLRISRTAGCCGVRIGLSLQ